MNDDDKTVISKIQTIADGAIKQTYKILQKRIDKFGVRPSPILTWMQTGVLST